MRIFIGTLRGFFGFVALVGTFSLATSNQASALTVTISEGPTAGQSTFTFSGTGIVWGDRAMFVGLGSNSLFDSVWHNFNKIAGDDDISAFFLTDPYEDAEYAAVSSNAVISANGVDKGIYGIVLRRETNSPEHGAFGIRLAQTDTFSAEAYDEISWSGSLTIDFAFANFIAGEYFALQYYSENGPQPDFQLDVIVEESLAVPIGAAAPLFFTGLGGLLFAGRRRKAQGKQDAFA